MRIAVVGAGIAGLACARRLVEDGHAVTVFERQDVPGGRVATLKTEVGGFDHGAQYLTARDPVFAAEVERWQAAGSVEPWPVGAKVLDGHADRAGASRAAGSSTRRWVGVPGMSAIASAQADGIDVRFGATVEALEPHGTGAGAGWHIRQRGDGPIAADESYDATVVTLPAPLAAPLLAAAPSLADRCNAVRIEPCWALLLGFAEPVVADPAALGDAAFVEHGRLAWIAREPSKPQRRVGERWTVHAQSGWSVEHFDDDPDDVKLKLLRAFHEATGSIEQPVYAMAFRWRHALVRGAVGVDYLWDPVAGVGACGDWCRGHRIEDAWLSGIALAAAITAGA